MKELWNRGRRRGGTRRDRRQILRRSSIGREENLGKVSGEDVDWLYVAGVWLWGTSPSDEMVGVF